MFIDINLYNKMYKIEPSCKFWCNIPEELDITKLHPDSLNLFHSKKWYNREIIEENGCFQSGNKLYRNGHHPLVQMNLKKCIGCQSKF